jgi:serine/threonine protein kinase
MVAIQDGERWLDRFELIAELATGGMATVYLARLSGVGGFQRFAAIKRLHPHLAREPEFIEMFLDEARLAARIHHPNVVPILEIGTSEHGYYLVMEYVEGDTLGRLLARSAQTGQQLPMNVGLRIVLDALAGLDASHELKDDDGSPLGIVHRDVSPQNVLVGIDGSARLTDFGVARATSRVSTTRSGHLKGKLAYMAPEQARGAKDIDRRADVFAIGIVLWEVMAGRRLFKGEGEADTLHKVLHEPIPALHSIAPKVPPEIDALVIRALDRDRTARFATAAEFGDALERAARTVGALGTHKDVAAHMDAALGTETVRQREALRSWLAEPGRKSIPPPSMRPPSVPPPRLPSADGESTPATQAQGFGALGEGPPSSVSSVTSAVGSTTLAPGEPAAAPAAPRGTRRRVGLWPWVAVVALAIAAAVGVGWMRTHVQSNSPLPPPSPMPSVAATPTAPPTTTRADSAPGDGLSTVASSPATSATASRPPLPPPQRILRAPEASATTSRPPPAATGSAVPDDMSRNPYR